MECENSGIMDSLLDDCFRFAKIKYDEFEGDNPLAIQEYMVTRVDIEDECSVLHEMVTNQQVAMQNLISELEEERSAAASAANEAMSMILRLQRDKAEIQMDARQFKRLAEEKMSHNQHETSVLEDLLYNRDQKILSLTSEIQSYRHLMSSYGIFEPNASPGRNWSTSMNDISEAVFDYPPYEIYPSVRCHSNLSPSNPNDDDEIGDMPKYAFLETLHSVDHLKDLESRIYQLENSSNHAYSGGELFGTKSINESVIVSHSPRKLSIDSMSSPFAVNKEVCTDFILNSPNFDIVENCDLDNMDCTLDVEDDLTDRIYTVDSVFHRPSFNPLTDPSVASPIRSLVYTDPRDLEIQKLYARVHALEADRESMRQSIISVGTSKAQMVFLKEIAQNLCKEMSPTQKILEKNRPENMTFSLKSLFKWLLSSITPWRKKKHRCRYMLEESAYNLLGLLILLETSPRPHPHPHPHHWRRIFKADVLKKPIQIHM